MFAFPPTPRRALVAMLWPALRRARPWLLRASVALAALLCGGLLFAHSLSAQAPRWWRNVSPADPRTQDAAEQLEYAISDQLHASRAGSASAERPEHWSSELWSASISASDANAWLNVRLPKWLANEDETLRWPSELAEVQIDFGQGDVRLGARLVAGGQDRIVWATFTPEIREDGALWLRARHVHLGRLSVPAPWVLGEAEDLVNEYVPPEFRDHPESRRLFDALAGRVPIVDSPTLRLADGRRVRLVAMQALDGRLSVACRTERELARGE
ncbi:MAG: hypothetical protein RBS39_07865 [Phycisphaerales bacterium]|jgi:hypothetical protein|nr:hypothetical protein [Phycisphaerales bacterium]